MMPPAALHALLIARREFLEHVRTRGFWLSLATVPLILLLSLAIPIASELAKPELSFAVTDRSGWVLSAIVRRADGADLARLLDVGDQAALPAPARRLLAHWAEAPPQSLDRSVEQLLDDPAEGPEQEFLSWWRGLDPAAVAALDPEAWRGRFRLVHDPALWVPPREARFNLGAERVFAWLEIPEDPVGRPDRAPDAVRYASSNLTNRDLREWFEAQLDAVVTRQRRREADLDGAVWAWIDGGADIELRTVDEGGTARRASTRDVLVQWGPVAFVYILWISIQVVTQMLLSSTVEEKSGKLVEVLLAATAPLSIMAGKILGIAATGMVIVTTWLTTFVVAAVGLPALLGVPATAGFADLATNPVYIASFLVYYVLGYLFYAALLSGIGAQCSSLKEAQTLAIPVQSLLLVPLLAMVPIARDPSGTLATVLTWLPPFTPFVMMNRAAQPPDATVYVGTTALMVMSVAAAFWLGARLFRIGVLTTGQAPGALGMLRLLAAGLRRGA